jgi:hypothetical protein
MSVKKPYRMRRCIDRSNLDNRQHYQEKNQDKKIQYKHFLMFGESRKFMEQSDNCLWEIMFSHRKGIRENKTLWYVIIYKDFSTDKHYNW